ARARRHGERAAHPAPVLPLPGRQQLAGSRGQHRQQGKVRRPGNATLDQDPARRPGEAVADREVVAARAGAVGIRVVVQRFRYQTIAVTSTSSRTPGMNNRDTSTVVLVGSAASFRYLRRTVPYSAIRSMSVR